VDNVFCEPITRGKYALGWPAAFLLEGHSWWHILTGVGTYLMIQGVICAFCHSTYIRHITDIEYFVLDLALCVKDDYSRYTIDHTSIGIPYVARIERVQPKRIDEKHR
jgi:dihydroceramidase